jgi:hypothetical protein
MGSSEGLSSLGIGVVLEAELLEDEEGASALELHRLDVAVPGVEAAKEVEHLTWLGDGWPMSCS